MANSIVKELGSKFLLNPIVGDILELGNNGVKNAPLCEVTSRLKLAGFPKKGMACLMLPVDILRTTQFETRRTAKARIKSPTLNHDIFPEGRYSKFARFPEKEIA